MLVPSLACFDPTVGIRGFLPLKFVLSKMVFNLSRHIGAATTNIRAFHTALGTNTNLTEKPLSVKKSILLILALSVSVPSSVLIPCTSTSPSLQMLRFLGSVDAQVSGQVNLLKSFMSRTTVPSLVSPSRLIQVDHLPCPALGQD